MSGVISEATGEAIQGTDQAAHSVSKPAVEVTFAVSRSGENAPLSDAARAGRIAAGIARMQASGATAGKATAAPAAKPAASAPAAPAAPAASPPLEVAKVDAAKPADAGVVADAAESTDADAAEPTDGEADAAAAETPSEGDAAAEPPADAEPAADAAAEPDAIAIAVHQAEIAARDNELALIRAERDRAQSGHVSDEERQTYIDRPLDNIRTHIAKMLGIKPDAAELAEELAHLQRELTLEAVGASNLPDERKQQRTVERYDRSERLKQTVRQASQATTQAAQQRTQVVGFVASTLEAARDEFPYAGLATELDGRAPGEVALDLWMAALKDGRIKVGESDAANVREALRLTNDHYKAKLAKLSERTQPKNTAPPPATAPAQASPTGAATGAQEQTKSRAPAPKKPASDAPKTLSAKQAAAAPVVKVTPDKKLDAGPATADPNDKDGRLKRIIEAGRRHLTK